MKRKPTLEELKYVQNEVNNKGKNVILAYVLTLFLGYLGVHLGYLRKKKLAFVRILLTLITIGSVYLIGTTVSVLETSEPTMKLQQYSSMITVVFGLSVGIHGLWLLFDLIVIPREVDKINSEIEKKATDSIMHSRYAAESIMSNEVYEKIVNESSKLAMEKVDSVVDDNLKEAREKITKIGNVVKSRDRDIEKTIENIESNIKRIDKLNNSLNEDIDSIQNTALKDLRYVKSTVRNYLDNELHKEEIIEDDKSEINKEESSKNDELTKNNKVEIDEKVIEKEQFESTKEKEVEVNEPEAIKEEKQDEVENVKKNEVVHDETSNVEINSQYDIEHTSIKDDLSQEEGDDKNEVLSNEDVDRSSEEESQDKTMTFSKGLNENDINEAIDSAEEVSEEKENSVGKIENASNNEIETHTFNVLESINENKCEISTEGYIVGAVNESGELIKKGIKSNSNIVIADNVDEDNIDKTLIVQLLKLDGLRDKFGLKGNPKVIGKKIVVTGFRDKYFNKNGIKKINDIKFVDK